MEVKERPLKTSGSFPLIAKRKISKTQQAGCIRSSTLIPKPITGRKMKKRLSRGAKRVPENIDKTLRNEYNQHQLPNQYQHEHYDHEQYQGRPCGDTLDYYPNCCLPIDPVVPKSTLISHRIETTSTAASSNYPEKRHIDVIVRIRPKNKAEGLSKTIVWRTSDTSLLFDPQEKTAEFFFKGKRQILRNGFGSKRPNKNLAFGFDYVYGPENTNEQIFDISLKSLINQVLQGFNCTVFAYGATGSGKTYTMLGSSDTPGITVLMAEELYQRLDGMENEHFSYDVKVSYLEVYNETIKDLLKPDKELNIREDGKRGIRIPQLTIHKPQGAQELLALLRSGNSARSQHATDFNSESSRSHAIFEITVLMHRHSPKERFKKKTATSRLFMVDLAGSEKGTFNFDGQRQREGANINKSLLALSNCINALADGKTHIPFRNSKLTRLLKDSLSDNCVTVMIANVSPAEKTFEDTHNTLHYANRAKNIKVACRQNAFSEELIEEAANTDKILDLENEIRILKEELKDERRRHKRTREQLRDCQDRMNVGDGDGFDNENFTQHQHPQVNSSPSKSTPVIHDPIAVDRFLELMKQKTEVMARLTESCTSARFHEWEMNWKKLKVDVADFVGRLDVSDPNFIAMARLKNMQNHLFEQYPQIAQVSEETKEELKDINSEIENVYRKCLNSLKLDGPFLTVTFEEFIGHRQLESEIQILDKLQRFHEQLCKIVFTELMSSQIHLVHSMKFIKTLRLKMQEDKSITPKLEESFFKVLAPLYCNNQPVGSLGSQQRYPVQQDLSNLHKTINRPVVNFPKNKPTLVGSSVLLISQYGSSDIVPTTASSKHLNGKDETSAKDTEELSIADSNVHIPRIRSPGVNHENDTEIEMDDEMITVSSSESCSTVTDSNEESPEELCNIKKSRSSETAVKNNPDKRTSNLRRGIARTDIVADIKASKSESVRPHKNANPVRPEASNK